MFNWLGSGSGSRSQIRRILQSQLDTFLSLDCCHVDESNKNSYSQRQLYKKSTSSISIHVCVPQCVQKRVLPAIYAQRSHLDPLDPVNPAPRGGLTGSKSEGSGSGFDQSKGCESSGSGGSGSRSYQTNMPIEITCHRVFRKRRPRSSAAEKQNLEKRSCQLFHYLLHSVVKRQVLESERPSRL